ncbi:uncharacterized protein TNCV_1421571 [Trichonephila clavipes]|nr:uncharacterized protein TNCV_1421571 [Trichonephila clavipes]
MCSYDAVNDANAVLLNLWNAPPWEATILDRVLGASGAGVHYRLFSVWTLVPVRLDKQLSDHSTVDEIASGAADYRLTYTHGELSSKVVKRRQWAEGDRPLEHVSDTCWFVGKTGRRKERKKKEKKEKKKRRGLVVLGSGEENPRVLFRDADEESKTRMRNNALWTRPRQAVDAREVPAFRFFPEKDEDVSRVSTCNVKVAKELRVEIEITLPKIEFKKRICQSKYYDEESVKCLLEGILAGKREIKESERETREYEERKLIREFELERMKLSNSTDTISVSSTDLEGQGVNRRAGEKRKVAEDRWVSQLIPLLPIEIAEIVAKEPLEKSDDYPHIKNLLLPRFQLTPIALRDTFESHQRRPGAMWTDLVFELRSYLDNWLAGMKVGDFAALKELLVTEQIKKSIKRISRPFSRFVGWFQGG